MKLKVTRIDFHNATSETLDFLLGSDPNHAAENIIVRPGENYKGFEGYVKFYKRNGLTLGLAPGSAEVLNEAQDAYAEAARAKEEAARIKAEAEAMIAEANKVKADAAVAIAQANQAKASAEMITPLPVAVVVSEAPPVPAPAPVAEPTADETDAVLDKINKPISTKKPGRKKATKE